MQRGTHDPGGGGGVEQTAVHVPAVKRGNAKFRAGANAVLAAYRMHQMYVKTTAAEPHQKKKHENTKVGQAQRLLAFAKCLNLRLGEDSAPTGRMHDDVYHVFDEICGHVAANTYTPAENDEELGAFAMMQGLGF